MSAAKPTAQKAAVSKSVSAPTPQNAGALTTSPPSGTFGFLIEVNGSPITVTASQLAAIPTQGLSFKYDPATPTEIGTLTTLVGWISSNLKVTIPLSDIENMPFIGKAVTAIATAPVTVSQFDISIAGSQSGSNSFDLQGTITLTSNNQPSLFGLTLVGFAFGVAYAGSS